MKTNIKQWLVIFVVALLGGVSALAIERFLGERKSMSSFELPSGMAKMAAFSNDSGNNLPDMVAPAENTVHAVVNIQSEFRVRTRVYDDYFGLFDFSPFGNFYREKAIMGCGSGVIISADGYIVTNNHVVQDAANIEVTLNDRQTYPAKLIGNDPSTDLAVLKIEATDLPFLTFGNSDQVHVGEWVLAVGNPFNLTSTVTAGIVSAKARNINILSENLSDSPIESFIQTDAAINSGNSGGALVNTKGELIGVNAAIASNTGTYAGYSFAIPANIAKKVTEDLIRHGVVQRSYIGASVELGSRLSASDKKITRGVHLGVLFKDGAAYKTGLKDGDVLIAMNNRPVNSRAEMMEVLGQNRPGDQLMLTVLRNDKPQDFKVVLLNQDGDTEVVMKSDLASATVLGARFENISAGDLNRYGLKNGVMIKEIGNSLLKNVGLSENFVLISIDREAVRNVQDVKVLASKKGKTLITGTFPGDWRTYQVVLDL